ncbi:MAG: CYTH domain-containing protein [Bacilli bacterium]|nr:CYTH domain-containing protein [Bacilli bacterium]
MEIERKFIVNRIPNINLEKFKPANVSQGYLTTKECETRIRKMNDDYYLTIKGNGDLIRSEVEFDITKEQFMEIKNTFNIPLIEKTRYKIPLTAKLIIELDIYHNELDGLKVAEIEFENELDAASFTPLSWFGEEVTYDPDYKNKNLINKSINNIKTYKKEF